MGHQYDFFDKIIYRAPINSIDSFFRIPCSASEISSFVKDLYKSESFKESIYLASPSFYREWEKIYNNISEPNQQSKIERNIIKYYIRSIFHCVPFGTFSSYSLLSDNNKKEEFEKLPYINYSFMRLIFNKIKEDSAIKYSLKYTLNNSIYKVGDTYRYMEYNHSKDQYQLSSIERNPVIDLLVKDNIAKSLNEYCEIIQNRFEGISKGQIFDFVLSLINNQILIVDTSLLINDIDFVSQLQNYSTQYPQINQVLKQYNNLLSNKVIKEFVDSYKIQEWNNLVKGHDEFTDSIINVNLKKISKISSSEILNEDREKVLSTIEFLNCCNSPKHDLYFLSNGNMKKFVKRFVDRYEDKEVPIMEALDIDAGIGYLDTSAFNQKDIIENLSLDRDQSNNLTKIIYDFDIDHFWIRKICTALTDGTHIIRVDNNEVENLKNERIKVNGTTTFRYSKVKDKLLFQGGGATSALHYVGRFTTQDPEMFSFSSEIIDFEKKYYADKIVAEIIHISTIGSGNLLSRNCKREYEIPIYTKHSLRTIPIYLNDILISVRNNKIILRSKKYKKEIIPYLSSAQNFHTLSSPIYNFLCDYQSELRQSPIYFNLNTVILQSFPYIPRIELNNNVILQPARWNLDANTISTLTPDGIQHLRDKFNIPRYIDLIENDSTITIDLKNEYLVTILENSYKKYKKIIIVENIFLNEIKDNSIPNESVNEYIFSLKINRSPVDTIYQKNHLPKSKRVFVPGDKWLYFKIYTTYNNVSEILQELSPINAKLIKKNIIESWFFIRYNDPEFHLRVRYCLNNTADSGKIIGLVNTKLRKCLKNKVVWKIEISTYERELERYFDKNIDFIEKIFSCDSDFVIDILKEGNKIDLSHIWILSVYSINDLFDIFKFDNERRAQFCENCFKSYGLEFRYNKKTRKQIDLLFRKYRQNIESKFSYNELKDIYIKRKTNIAYYIEQFIEILNSSEIEQLLGSLIHMHLNRFLEIRPRFNEFIVYGILTKYYKTMKWQIKNI